MGTVVVPKTFAEKLQAEIDQRPGWGVRTLARRMAAQAGQPHRIESLRRQLRKYLGPDAVTPTVLTRHAIEDALDLERGALAPDPREVSPSGGRFRGGVGDGAARGADGAGADAEAAGVARAGAADVNESAA